MGNIKLYKVEELAEILSVTPWCVRQYCREGKIKAIKVGKRWLITEEALREFLQLNQN